MPPKDEGSRRRPSRGRGQPAAARSGRAKPHRAAGGAAAPGGRRRRDPVEEGPPSAYEPIHIADEVVRELSMAARPGKSELLVKVFADAVAAYAAGDLDEAIRLGDQAKHMALRSPNVREFLGLAYYRAGRWKEAARELAAYRRISGSTNQNPVIADCYRATQRPEKAIGFCDEIDRSSVGEAVFYEAQIVAAGALADMGRLDEAVERLQRLELEPEVAEEHHLRVWYVLGDLLERQGRFTQARSWFEAVTGADADLTDASERAAKLSSD